MQIKLIKKNKKGRIWEIQTPHGVIRTPFFMPDATYGCVIGLSSDDLLNVGTEALCTTTLHIEQKLNSLYIKNFGGIHKFMSWDKPILTDSGGFQVFSLLNKDTIISDVGCSFTSEKEGSYNFLSPENSQIIQHNLGSDFRVVLDEPVIEDDSLANIKRSVKRTTAWAKRSKDAFLKLNNLTEEEFEKHNTNRPLLCAVVQGANNFKYREKSAKELIDIGFDIYSFGGNPKHSKYSWKENAPQGFNKELVAFVANLIPENKMRYGLGIGNPDNLKFAIEHGWDIFDCVLPTRNARHGYLYVHKGEGDSEYETYNVLHIKNKRYEFSDEPIDKKCNCLTCKSISRAYLRYLLKQNSPTGIRYATIHNLNFFNERIKEIRDEIYNE